MPGDDKAAEGADKAAPVVQFQFAQKPVELPGWEGFKQFLWNSETQEFLGRTGCSWFKIGLFYVVYYLFLTAYFIAMLVIFYQTLDETEPKWKGANALIGDNPGLGFRPSPDPDHVETTLVQFRHGEYNGNWDGWAKRLDEYLQAYRDTLVKTKPNPNIVPCNWENLKAGESQICQVEAAKLLVAPCTNDTNYGFKDGAPCMLLKLNKIYDWMPDLYENSSEFPATAPRQLVEYVKEKERAKDPMVGKMVWMSCEGENPADRENIGEIEYFPQPGIPNYYFPYKNQDGYLSPVIFAHLKNPKHGVLISISCKAWAKNIKHDVQERLGTVHFELMID